MYSLLFISLVQSYYKDWCDEQDDAKTIELDKVIAKVLKEDVEDEEEDEGEIEKETKAGNKYRPPQK